MPVSIEVQNLKDIQRSVEQITRRLKGTEMQQAMQKAVLLVERDAKINAPVDTGRLRASIVPEVRTAEGDIVEGVVGSNVEYAPYQEYGTSRMGGKVYLGRAYVQNIERIKALIGEVVEKMTHQGNF